MAQELYRKVRKNSQETRTSRGSLHFQSIPWSTSPVHPHMGQSRYYSIFQSNALMRLLRLFNVTINSSKLGLFSWYIISSIMVP
jgi:hypothetical protein